MTDTPDEVTRMAREIAERHGWPVGLRSVEALIREALLTRLPIPEDEALLRAQRAAEEYAQSEDVVLGAYDTVLAVGAAKHALLTIGKSLEPPKPKDEDAEWLRYEAQKWARHSEHKDRLERIAARLEQKGGEA